MDSTFCKLFRNAEIQSSEHLARAMYKWCSRGGMGFKTSDKVAMTLQAWILGILLLIAVIYIAVDWLLSWLMNKGGFLIRIEVVDGED